MDYKNPKNILVNLKIRPFELDDLPKVVDLWNRTAKNRTLYYPLSKNKIKSILLEQTSFDQKGFLIAEDNCGLAGGIVVNAVKSEDGCGTLKAIFTRTGKINDPVSQLLMNEAIIYLKTKGLKKVATTLLSDIDAKDLEMLEFLWLNRFIFPGIYDQLINQNIACVSTFLGRKIEGFSIPDDILSLQRKLEAKGYRFRSYASDKHKVSLETFDEFPFAPTFKRSIKTNSSLEDLFLAFYDSRCIGGALVSLPYAPTDWPLYGCDCGLFGPTGVARQYRGSGIGRVLLFQSINRLRERNSSYALIPTNPTTYPFYLKAGFEIARVSIRMERSLREVKVRFREVG